MRRRKRADWPIRVYKYSVRLEHDTWERLPAGAQREIEATRALWNQLSGAFEQRQARYREIVSQCPQGTDGQQEESMRPALEQLQRSFLAETRQLTADCPATWANREFILTQFFATAGRFFKKQGRVPKPKHGAPFEVHFHHRFAGGGFPIEGIFGRSQRLRLDPVPAEAFHPALPQRQRKRLARTTGAFQVGDIVLPFQLLLHRPLPAGAYLKTAALIGRQILRDGYHQDPDGGHRIPGRWVWSLHLTLEIPPQVISASESTDSTVVFDARRQVGGEGQLRIGVLSDATGREEPLFLPEEILRSWQYKRALQRQADQLLDETKGLLQHLQCGEQLPDTAQSLLARLGTVRNTGLWRLLQVLEQANTDEAALEIVRRWADRASKIHREARGLERRYLGHRDWFYRNLAAQLCRRYRQVIVKVPDRREFTGNSEENQTSQEKATYRQLAAPSTLLVFLRQAAAKTGTEVKEEDCTFPDHSLLAALPAA